MYLAGQSLRWRQFSIWQLKACCQQQILSGKSVEIATFSCQTFEQNFTGAVKGVGFLLSAEILEPQGLEQYQNNRFCYSLIGPYKFWLVSSVRDRIGYMI